MYKIYGIKNCDRVKKTCHWLDNHHISYQFHDYRVDGINQTLVARFATEFGWETVLNRRSTSWRQLPDHQKTALNEEKAIKLMLDNPTLIKRPILETDQLWLIGFNAERYQQLL